jgi:hypothetical protein
VRIGRASAKWKSWECEAFARARKETASLRLLVMEPPAALFRAIEAGRHGSGILARSETTDFEWLQTLYGAADLMVHASSGGESFGYTIAEAMAAGLPVIVRTTPWGDSAQVELVQNGATGFVCASVGEMARRWVDLANNPTLRSQMGHAAKTRIQQLASTSRETDMLEAVIMKVLTGEVSPLLTQRTADILAFAKSFRKLEWATSERAWEHPADLLGARCYGLYRSVRLSIWKWRMRLKNRLRN